MGQQPSPRLRTRNSLVSYILESLIVHCPCQSLFSAVASTAKLVILKVFSSYVRTHSACGSLVCQMHSTPAYQKFTPYGNRACCNKPVSSGIPMTTFRFWMACPEAPFTRLSITAQPQTLCSQPRQSILASTLCMANRPSQSCPSMHAWKR